MYIHRSNSLLMPNANKLCLQGSCRRLLLFVVVLASTTPHIAGQALPVEAMEALPIDVGGAIVSDRIGDTVLVRGVALVGAREFGTTKLRGLLGDGTKAGASFSAGDVVEVTGVVRRVRGQTQIRVVELRACTSRAEDGLEDPSEVHAAAQAFLTRKHTFDYAAMRANATKDFEILISGKRMDMDAFEAMLREMEESRGGRPLSFYELAEFNTEIMGDVAYTTWASIKWLESAVFIYSCDRWLMDRAASIPAAGPDMARRDNPTASGWCDHQVGRHVERGGRGGRRSVEGGRRIRLRAAQDEGQCSGGT